MNLTAQSTSFNAADTGAKLSELGISHVRTGLFVNTTRVDDLMAAIPNMRLLLIGGMQLHKVYRPNNSRLLPACGTNGGRYGWDQLKTALDNANRVAVNGAATNDAVSGIEGVNEPNGKWEPTKVCPYEINAKKCTNGWIERAADQQRALLEYLRGGNDSWSLPGYNPGAHPTLDAQADLVGWSNGNGNVPGCWTVASAVRPFLEAQKDFAVDYAGFPAWNAGGTLFNGTLPSLIPGAGSVMSSVEVANVHAYPPFDQTPEWLASSAPAGSGSTRDCGTQPVAGDPATSLTTGLPEAGLRTCAAYHSGLKSDLTEKPVYITETGYDATLNSDAVRATYMPRLLLSNYRYGFKRTYLYELFANSNHCNCALIQGGQKTLAYHSVRNTMSLLGQQGSPAAGALDVTIGGTGAPSVRSQLLRTGASSYALALWPTDSVRQSTPDNTGPRITPPTRSVTVTLGGGPWNGVFRSPTPASLTDNGPRTVRGPVSGVTSFTLDLSGDAVVVALTPAA